MADRICTRFIDNDGLDIGCHLVSKEYVLEAYPELVPWMKVPALWVWGRNYNSVLGTNNSDTINRSSPVQTVSSGTNWKSVSATASHSSAIKTDGTLWLWGSPNYGGLGNNNITIIRSSPVQTISGGTNWKSVSSSVFSTAAIKTDGTLWMWGYGSRGNLGNNSILHQSSPVQTISGGTNWKSVSNTGTVGAIKTDGTLWAWGVNVNGTLGNNGVVNIDVSSPVQTVSGGTNWKSVSMNTSTAAAIKTDGTLWLWGAAYTGTLGNNTSGSLGPSRSSPIQTISGGTNWRSVAIGPQNVGAIKTDGTLWVWGGNTSGQLGTNDIIRRSTPVQTVSGGTNWFKTSLYTNNITAIKTDGSLWMWGCGYYGEFGNNAIINRSTPVQIISSKTSWKDVSMNAHILAISDEGDF